MSNVIDERVLKMVADTGSFDGPLEDSYKVLDKFEKRLDSMGSGKDPFSSLEKSLKGLDIGGLFKDIEGHLAKLDFRTTAIGKEFQRYKDAAVHGISSFGKELLGLVTTLGQVQDGFQKFENKTSNVGTLVAQGYSMDTVTEQMDRLIRYTDETSYNFTEMVSNIGKFTATGQKLDKSVTAMMGIANWAALSGQSAQKATQAMYQLSQAMGKGVLKYDDWKSIQNASMDTKEFRQMAVDIGVQMGKIKEVGNGLYTIASDSKKTMFSLSEMFTSDALSQKGWFDSELMMATFEKYAASIDDIFTYAEEHEVSVSEAIDAMGGSVDAFGVKALRAAQEARTWTDVLQSLKDAVSTGWMDSYEIIFGNYEEAKTLFTNMANDLWDLVTVVGEWRNALLRSWRKDGGRKAFFDSIVNGLNAIKSVIAPLSVAWNSIFPENGENGLTKASKFLEKFTRSLILTEDQMFALEEKIRVVLGVFKLLGGFFKKEVFNANIFDKIIGALETFKSTAIGAQLPIDTLIGWIEKLKGVWKGLVDAFKSGENVWSSLHAGLAYVADSISKVVKSIDLKSLIVQTNDGKVELTKFGEILVRVGSILNVVFKAALVVGKLAIMAFGAAFATVAAIIYNNFPKIVDWFSKLPEKILTAKKAIQDFYTNLKESSKSSAYMSGVIKAFEQLFKTIKDIGQKTFDGIFKSFQNLMSGKFKMPSLHEFIEDLKTLGRGVLDFIDKIDDLKQALMGGFKTPLSYLIDYLKEAFGEAEKFVSPFTRKKFFGEGGGNAKKGEALGYVESISESLGVMSSRADTTSRSLDMVRASAVGATQGMNSLGTVIHAWFDNLSTEDNIFGFIARSIKELVSIAGGVNWNTIFAFAAIGAYVLLLMKLAKAVKSLGGVIDKTGTKIEDGIKKVTNTVAGSLKDMFNSFGKITTVYDAIAGYFKTLGKNTKYNNFKSVAAGLLMVAAALAVLAFIPWPKLVQAGTVLAIVAGGLLVLSAALTHFSKTANPVALFGIATAFVGFSVALLTAAGTLRSVVKLLNSGGDIAGALTTIGLLAAGIVSVMYVLAAVGPISVKSSLSLLLFAISLSSFFSVLRKIVTDTEVLEALKKAIKSFFDYLWRMVNEEPWKAIIGVESFALGILAFVGALYLASQMAAGAGKNMLYFALSLGVMYYAIKMFSSLPFPEIAAGLVGIAGGIIALAGIAFVISLIPIVGDSIKDLGKSIKRFAVAVLILTGAIAIMTHLDLDKAGEGVIHLGLTMIFLAGAVAIMGKAKPEKVAAALIAMVVSLYLLLPVIMLFSALPLDMVAKGILAVGGALLAMGGAVKMMGGAKIGSLIVGFAAMGSAIWVLVWALTSLSTIDYVTLLSAAAAISMIVLTFGAMASELTNAKAACATLAASMFILSFAIPIMCAGFKTLEGVDWSTILAAAGAIAIVTIALAGMSKIIAGTKGVVGAMFSLSFAMILLGAAAIPFCFGMSLLGNVKWDTMLWAAVAMVALAAGLTVLGAIMAVVPGTAANMIGLSFAMLIFSGAAVAFAFAATLIKNLGPGWAIGIAVGVGLLAGALGALIVVLSFVPGSFLVLFGLAAVCAGVALACVGLGYAIGVIIDALGRLLPILEEFVNQTSAWDVAGTAVGVGLLGFAFMVLAAGCLALAGGLYVLNLAFAGAKEMIEWFADGAKQLSDDIQAVASSIAGFIDDIVTKVEEFKNSDIVQGVIETVDGIKKAIEDLQNWDPKEGWDNFWANIGNSLRGGEEKIAPVVAESVGNGVSSGMEQAAPRISDSAVNTGDLINEKLQERLVTGGTEAGEAGGEAIVSAYENTMMDEQTRAYMAAYDLSGYTAQGFGDGVNDHSDEVGQAGETLVGKFMNCITSLLQIESPSKWMHWVANMCGSGFLEGIAEEMEKAEEAGASYAESFGIAVQSILENLPLIAEECGGSFLDTIQTLFGQLPEIGSTSLGDFLSSISGFDGDMATAAQGLVNSFEFPLDSGFTNLFNFEEGRFADFIARILAMINSINATMDAAEIKLRARAERMNAIAKANHGMAKNMDLTDAGTGNPTENQKIGRKRAVKEAFNQFGSWVGELTGANKDAEDSANAAADAFDNLGGSAGGAGDSLGGAGKAAGDAAKNIQTLTKYTDYASQTADAYAKSFGSAYAIMGNTDPMTHAQAAVDELAEAIYLDSLEASGAVEDASMSAEERAQAVQEAFNEAFEDIKNDVKESIDFFNEFSQTIEDMTPPEKILSNAKSQLDGMASLGQKYIALAKKGFSQEVIGEIQKEGVSALGKVNSLLLFNIDQVAAYNQNYINKTVVASAVASQAMAARAIAIQRQHLEASAAAGDALAQEALNLININANATDTLMKFQVKYETMHDTVKEAIESQMDLFSKLELKTETSSDEMLANMRSQIQGITQWAAECEQLGARGIDEGLLAKLESLGPDGYEKLHAFVTMSDAQLQEANTLYQQSLALPESAATQVATSYAMAGQQAGEQYALALQQFMITNTAFESALGGWTVELLESVKAQLAELAPLAGQDAVEKYAGGISTNEYVAVDTGTDLGNNTMQAIIDAVNEQAGPLADTALEAGQGAYDAVDEHVNETKGHEQGYYYGGGIAQGIRDSIGAITEAAAAAAQAAVVKIATKWDENSPSRVGYRLGMYWDMGIANGIGENADLISNNAELIADTAINSMTNALKTANDIIEGNPLSFPTITPVMDLSQIQNGIGSMGGLFDNMTIPYNGNFEFSRVGSADLLGAIRGVNGGTTTYGNISVNVYAAPGQNASEIADMTLDKLNRQIRRQKAAFA